MTVIYFSNFSNPFIRMTSVTVCGSQFHSITMKKNTFHSLKVYLLFFFFICIPSPIAFICGLV